eukprot:gene6459-8885_t
MNSATIDDPSNQLRKISPEFLMANMKQVDYAFTVLYIISGIINGLLGCTGLRGLIVFCICSFIITLSILIKIKFQVLEYLNLNALGLLAVGVSNHAMSFVLFWTLSYALVHIYSY